MDKITINNQVVSMRKFVKQAKTRAINKCTKEIKLLQNRKGNENQVLKCKRKAERLLLEVGILKKIKPDSVSKMALSKAKDWKAVLTQKNIPLEERCFAILASYDSVQTEVEKFHSANSYLVPKISTLVQEWEEKTKLTSQSPLKNKAVRNARKVSGANKTEINQRDITKTEDKSEVRNAEQSNLQDAIIEKQLDKEGSEMSDIDGNFSDSMPEDVELEMKTDERSSEHGNFNVIDSKKIFEVSETKDNENNLNLRDTNPSSSKLEGEDNCSRNSQERFESLNTLPAVQESKLKVKSVKNNHNHHKKSSQKIQNRQTVENIFSAKSNSTKAVALVNLNEMLEMDEIPIESRTDSSIVSTIEESGKRKRDAFFLNEGEDFSESENGKESDDNSEPSQSPFKKKQRNDFNKKDSHNNQFKTERNSFKNKRNSENLGFRGNAFKNGNRNFHSREKPDRFGNMRGKQENSFNKNRSNSFEKGTGRQENRMNKIWNSTGKKERTEQRPFRSFSDKPFEKGSANNEKKNNSSRNKPGNFNKGGNKDELPLHPSWEAKRKLKSSVKAKFQGKRVVFDE